MQRIRQQHKPVRDVGRSAASIVDWRPPYECPDRINGPSARSRIASAAATMPSRSLSGPDCSAGPTPDAGGGNGSFVAQYQEAPFGEADGHGLQEFCVEVAARAVREDEFADRVAAGRCRYPYTSSVSRRTVSSSALMTVEATVE
ncbi:hypothetical protein GS451_25840 [Rhodococcus hoagii]|nr:hypothetical protein [Prescottella equi]